MHPPILNGLPDLLNWELFRCSQHKQSSYNVLHTAYFTFLVIIPVRPKSKLLERKIAHSKSETRLLSSLARFQSESTAFWGSDRKKQQHMQIEVKYIILNYIINHKTFYNGNNLSFTFTEIPYDPCLLVYPFYE